MKEIGSEFWDIPIAKRENALFPKNTQWYVSGRSALKAIIAELKTVRSVSLPSWCCDSIIKPFLDAGINVDFYPVYWNSGLTQKVRLDNDALLIMDYFGYTTKQPDLTGYQGIIIRDVTHSLFSRTYSDSHYYFGSLRKWCGVWTGGYAWTCNGHKNRNVGKVNEDYIILRKTAMQQKADYIKGAETGKQYLTLFNNAEAILEDMGIVSADQRDVKMASLIDINRIRTRRRENAAVLREAFGDWLIFPEISEEDTPMFVPIQVPYGRRDSLRCYLVDNNIYCPVHWPISRYHKLDRQTKILYENELSLVCDQRYTKDDMFRIVDLINTFWKEV